MKKSVLFSTILLLSAGAASADEATALRLTLADAGTEVFCLDEKPQITFSGTEMTITSQALSATYERSEVKAMDFIEVTSVDALSADEVCYTLHGNEFSCPGQAVAVYSLAGTQVAAGTGSVSLADLKAGIYIINVNHKSIKVIKR